ncbi:hypothetical protein CW304_21230 [Bacillus sp. UFRGS-B20]|nr:hypothetical protein CW304_21230 [Bacillus sp. UFRGS-B20]
MTHHTSFSVATLCILALYLCTRNFFYNTIRITVYGNIGLFFGNDLRKTVSVLLIILHCGTKVP